MSDKEENLHSPALPPEFLAGLPSRYKIEAELGRGGMGVVLRALDLGLGRTVAIKILSGSGVADDGKLQRFLREAKTLAVLDHPNIVKLLSWGVSADKYPYHVLEYLEGVPLSELLKKEERLSSLYFASVFLQIASGLQNAHEMKVVHRDLKPSNVIICKNAESALPLAKIIDFGIAACENVGSDAESVKLTRTNVLLGSPLYMSPEQCRSQPFDKSSDLYSLACIMYEALTGAPPFNGESAMEIMYKHANDDWVRLETLVLGVENKQLARLIDACLSKDAAMRPELSKLKALLEQILKAQSDSRRFFSLAEVKQGGQKYYLALALVSFAILLVSLYFMDLKHKQKQSMQKLVTVESSNRMHQKSVDVEGADFLRLQKAFKREKNSERRRALAVEVIDTGRQLSNKQADIRATEDSIKTLESLYVYCPFMDEPGLARVQILKVLALRKADQSKWLECRNFCTEGLKILHDLAHDLSEDASSLLGTRMRSNLWLKDYRLALKDLAQLEDCWSVLQDPYVELEDRNRVVKKERASDDFAMQLICIMDYFKGFPPKSEVERIEALQLLQQTARILHERNSPHALRALAMAEDLCTQVPRNENEKLISAVYQLRAAESSDSARKQD